jgi:hypothetical protein
LQLVNIPHTLDEKVILRKLSFLVLNLLVGDMFEDLHEVRRAMILVVGVINGEPFDIDRVFECLLVVFDLSMNPHVLSAHNCSILVASIVSKSACAKKLEVEGELALGVIQLRRIPDIPPDTGPANAYCPW